MTTHLEPSHLEKTRGLKWPYNIIIIDESSKFKEHKTRRNPSSVVPKRAWPVYDSVLRFAELAGGHGAGKKSENYYARKAFQSCDVFCARVGWHRLGVDAINYLINKDTGQ